MPSQPTDWTPVALLQKPANKIVGRSELMAIQFVLYTAAVGAVITTAAM